MYSKLRKIRGWKGCAFVVFDISLSHTVTPCRLFMILNQLDREGNEMNIKTTYSCLAKTLQRPLTYWCTKLMTIVHYTPRNFVWKHCWSQSTLNINKVWPRHFWVGVVVRDVWISSLSIIYLFNIGLGLSKQV